MSQGPFITTMSGIEFEFLDPKSEQFDITDIAHALSQLCRFGGHTREFYSVAEHSCRVAFLCRQENQFAALMHDAQEAYLIDLPHPLKKEIDEYQDIESIVSHTLRERFSIPICTNSEVTAADAILFATEAQSLTNLNPALWAGVAPLSDITPWPMEVARSRFLYYFEKFAAEENSQS